MTSYFIAGTGTGVGKTLFTAALVSQARRKGHAVTAIKPVITGFDAGALAQSDTGQLLAAQSLLLDMPSAEKLSPWRFKAPLSVDMAAQDEGRALDFNRLVGFCKVSCAAGSTLIESAGGVLSPLDETRTMLDWADALALPVILVAGSYLGTLSHTLSAAQAVLSRGLSLHTVVLSESPASPVPPVRTVESLRRFLPSATTVRVIARLDSCANLWNYAPDLTESFFTSPVP